MESCFPVSLALSFLFVKTFSTEAAPLYAYHHCPNTTLFTPNSTYRSNLNTLLSALSSAATNSTSGFANATAGQNPPDQAYGIFLCLGYYSAGTCSDCMATAKDDILQRCPNQRVSAIWYAECMLRYSNEPIFSVVKESPLFGWYNTGETPDPAKFVQVLGNTIEDVAIRASGTRFATKEANVSTSMKLYVMAQCTPDLKSWDCNTCLRSVISQLPLGKKGGTIFTPSCNVRFELYSFYNAFVLPAPLASPVTADELDLLHPALPPRPPRPLRPPQGKCKESIVVASAIVIPAGGVMVLVLLTWCLLRRKGKKTHRVVKDKRGANEFTTVESLQFDLSTIQTATNYFSPEYKLGEGGFGEVFQGRLLNGQQIAVKRLSQSSRQGDEEFKNEVLLVAKLQHRNLVRLHGFCLEGDEKLLVYEFVPNKSLDYFLYDVEKRGHLDWSLRYKIIYGIARGLLYLHEDSRLRIIHRDLKCSNILLDGEMQPKISDFGMARIFGVHQIQAKTNRIVGTFGYMSPEYAMHGEFSVKSDVYSFGILLLEIICGKRNNFYHQLNGGEYLASHTWNQWMDGMPLEVLDRAIVESYSRDEVLRCLHICLLCIQEDPARRPTMATVVLMLSSNSFNLPSPQHPAFFVRSQSRGINIPMTELEADESTSRIIPSSTNGMSITELHPR